VRIAISNASREWRGTETVAAQLALGLRRRGHDILLICRRNGPLYGQLRDEVECAPVLRRLDASPAGILSVARALRRHATDVVIAQKEKDVRITGPAAALVRRPLIVRHETDRPLKRRPHYRLLYGWLPEHHITNSEATKQTILDSAPWLSPDEVSVLPNAVEAEPFLSATPAMLGLPPEAVAVGYIGRLEERKGVLDLALAWHRVSVAAPAAHLLIAGTGPLEGQLREALHGAPRVHWLGFRTDVPNLLNALDLAVVPSHFEGFGLSALEAMAAGLPVVAARASSLPELVADGVHGRLVEPHAADCLAAAILELVDDPGARRRMGRAGREHVLREYTVERMLDRHEELLARIARRRGTRVADSLYGARSAGRERH
jgi:glycosyltransferase involved in cell wall biosynthesis